MIRRSILLAGCIAVGCALAALRAQAETAVALQRESLRSEPYIDAPATGTIDKDVRIEVLKRQGNWALVRAGPREGWVRSLNLRSLESAKLGAAAPTGLLALESGRGGSRDLIATTGIRGAGKLAVKALHDIHAYRDDARDVQLAATKSSLRIGKDNLELTLRSRETGYAYLLMVGSDGKNFELLFPNLVDADNRIEAGATLQLPRPTWPVTAQGPVGADTLLAIVAATPRDYSQAGLRAAGPFLSIGATAEAARALETLSRTAGQAENAACAGGGSTAKDSGRKPCLTAYGAAMLTIDETR